MRNATADLVGLSNLPLFGPQGKHYGFEDSACHHIWSTTSSRRTDNSACQGCKIILTRLSELGALDERTLTICFDNPTYLGNGASRGIWTLTPLRQWCLRPRRLPIPPSKHMVRDVGLEPTHTWTPVPKTGASAIPPIPHNSISGSAAPTAASLSRFTLRSAKSVKQIYILFTSLIH